jgi:hypothetical protein
MSLKMNSSQIAFIINDCLEGVEKSKMGPVFVQNPDGSQAKDSYGNPLLSQVGFQVFMNVLGCYFPKNFTTEFKSDV